MNKMLIFLWLLICTSFSYAEKLENKRQQIDEAQKKIELSIMGFSDKMTYLDLDSNLNILLKTNFIKEWNEFYDYTIGGLLYEIYPAKSFEFHQSAFYKNSNDINFILEYALELHRKQNFDSAIILYEKYLTVKKEDYRIYALLADCYFNQNKLKEGISNWKLAKHESNHTSIDFAIHIIYGNYHQITDRNKILIEIKNNDFHSLEDLIYMDLNWETDWWNSTMIQEEFLENDLNLIKEKLDSQTKHISY